MFKTIDRSMICKPKLLRKIIKRPLAAVLGLIFTVLFPASAFALETPLVTEPYDQNQQSVYADQVVFTDGRNGNKEIYLKNISTGAETRITANSYEQSYPDIYADKIVYMDNRNGNYDIYLYDLNTSAETRLTTDPSSQ